MNTNNITELIPGLNLLPPQWQAITVQGFALSLVIGRIIQAIRNGGGLKNILGSVWLGTNQPKDKQQ